VAPPAPATPLVPDTPPVPVAPPAPETPPVPGEPPVPDAPPPPAPPVAVHPVLAVRATDAGDVAPAAGTDTVVEPARQTPPPLAVATMAMVPVALDGM
jgi:hypothetical protein